MEEKLKVPLPATQKGAATTGLEQRGADSMPRDEFNTMAKGDASGATTRKALEAILGGKKPGNKNQEEKTA